MKGQLWKQMNISHTFSIYCLWCDGSVLPVSFNHRNETSGNCPACSFISLWCHGHSFRFPRSLSLLAGGWFYLVCPGGNCPSLEAERCVGGQIFLRVRSQSGLPASPGVFVGINRSILLQSSKSDCLSVNATSPLKSRLACWDQLPQQLHSPVASESDRRDSDESTTVAGLQVRDPYSWEMLCMPEK